MDKKRDKIERKILDSQERAFWDVHRPVVSEPAAQAEFLISARGKCQNDGVTPSLLLKLGELFITRFALSEFPSWLSG